MSTLLIICSSQEAVTTTEENVCVAQHSSEPVEVQHDDTQEETYQLRYTKIMLIQICCYIYLCLYLYTVTVIVPLTFMRILTESNVRNSK